MKQGEFTHHQYWPALLFMLVAVTSRVEKAVNETLQALILAAVYESLFVLKQCNVHTFTAGLCDAQQFGTSPIARRDSGLCCV